MLHAQEWKYVQFIWLGKEDKYHLGYVCMHVDENHAS